MNNRLNKLLIVSSSLFPKRSGSAIVMGNLLKHFDPAEAIILGEIGPLKRKPAEESLSHQHFYFRSRLSFGGRGDRFLSLLRWQFHLLLQRYIERVAKQQQVSAILGVYPDDFYCSAACRAARSLGLPFSSYFHNTYADNVAVNSSRAQRLQPEIFANSRQVFVMSDGMLRHFEQRYPGQANFVTLPHTFDAWPQPETTAHRANLPIKVVLFGNFNESNMDATRRLSAALLSQPDKFSISIYSDVPSLLLQQRGLPLSKMEYCGSLSHHSFDNLIAELRRYDLIALTHGFKGGYGDVEYETIFPTRTIPMLLAGRPILLHSPPQSFLTRFFRESQAATIIDTPEPSAILSVFNNELWQDPRLIANAWQASQQFYGPQVAQKLRSNLFE
jgi:hypothetical protein